MKIVLGGATGFIGRPLVASLLEAGHDVVVLTRDPGRAPLPAGARAVRWDGASVTPEWAGELRDAGAVVNLAGASLGDGRWTEARKRVLRSSRIDANDAIVSAIEAIEPPARPATFVSASGIDYYGDRGDEIVTEESEPGTSFLAQLCVDWEAAARRAEPLGVRVVLMRTAVVFGKGASALERLVLPFKLFAGGPLGDGRQWFPWVHLADAIGLYRFAIESERVTGPLNVVAPDVRRQKDLAAEVGKALRRPSWIPAPAFALKAALGQQAELILHGRRAEPRKALALGYQFEYAQLPEALREALT